MTADRCDSFPYYFLSLCVVLVNILLPGRMTNHTECPPPSFPPPALTPTASISMCVIWQHRQKVCSGVDEWFEDGCSMVCDKVRQCSGGRRLQLRLWHVAHITNITRRMQWPWRVWVLPLIHQIYLVSGSGVRHLSAPRGGANNCAIVQMLFEVTPLWATLMEEWLNWGLNCCHLPPVANHVRRRPCTPCWGGKKNTSFSFFLSLFLSFTK